MSQRLVGGFIPPAAPFVGDPSGMAHDPRDRDLDLWNYLLARPVISIAVPAVSASKILFNRQCILLGWSLRETTGTAPAQVEFINGADATGEIVGEAAITAPLTGSSGLVDVDVDSSSNNPAAANTVTLPGVAGATTYITGFELTGLGATALVTIQVTVAGVLGGNKTYFTLAPAGVTAEMDGLFIFYSRPLPASAINTPIQVAATSPGAGNTAFALTAHGFQRTVGASGATAGQAAVAGLPSPGVFCRSGVFMRMIAGSVTGAIYVKA